MVIVVKYLKRKLYSMLHSVCGSVCSSYFTVLGALRVPPAVFPDAADVPVVELEELVGDAS